MAEGPWYHGTSHDFRPGDLVTVGHPSNYEGGPDEPPGSWTDDHAYFTSEPDGAHRHARNSAFVKGGEPRVYQVEPTGPYEPTQADRDSFPRPVYNYQSEHPLRVIRRVDQGQRTAAWSPQSGIFAPTTGLDPQLFEGGSLRPRVRAAIMERLDRCLRVDSGLAGSDWQEWLHVWIAGGSASEWAGNRPNDQAQDLDIIVGLDLAEAQGNSSFEGMDQAQAATALNAAFRHCFNETGWHAPFGGVWDLTAYCNPYVGNDITVIRPYAAWDLSRSQWSVKSPHLPEHTLADFDPAVVAHARAVLAEARAVLRMPEPLRTREARSLWAHVHEHRCQAFSAEGTGWDDPGNLDEKMLAYAPRGVLEKIRELAMARTAALRVEDYEGQTGNLSHITRNERGTVPTAAVAGLLGREGERPGEHRNRQGEDWEAFKRDIAENGIREPLFITVDHGEEPRISEGSHRRDAAVELGLDRVPVEIRYFGHAEQQGSVADRISRTAAREEAAENPPCRHCGEPLDDSDMADGARSHDECDEMRWCNACDDYHDDPQEAEDHNESYTDWSEHLPFEGGIHRGITVKLPSGVHAVVHDEARPPAERAAALAVHLRDNPADRSEERGHAGGYGMHWTDHEPVARNWGTGNGAMFGPSEDERSGPAWTHVVMHAASPDEGHIETDPRVLSEGNLLGFGHDRTEREIPLRAAAPVRLTGLSWKRADQPEWHRHDFREDGSRVAVREEPTESHDVYLRFGRWPKNERSYSPAGKYREKGVSVYHLDENGDPSLGDDSGWDDEEDDDGYSKNPSDDMEDRVHRAERNRLHGKSSQDEEAHLVRGTMVGTGYDGEPLLRNVRRVGDWMDHRHLFIPTAEPHSLAREESSEGYQATEEPPGRHVTAAREDAWEDPDEDTDRYVTCGQGHDHWGAAGAAGLLIRHKGEDGRHRYLLQHRSPYVQHGGTWSTPGGALQHGESPERGAMREAEEEFGSLPSGLRHHHTFSDDHGGWAYHTVVMDSPRRFEPEGEGEGDWETQGHGWFTPGEMKGLQLHPGFAASWEKVRKSGAVQPSLPFANGSAAGDGPFEPGDHPGPFLHGSVNRIEPGSLVHQDAMPRDYGRSAYSYFTTDRQVAEDAADMRNGRGHGWIRQVEPTGPYDVDHGEPDSFRSAHPLRVTRVEPGRLNGTAPHAPILREASSRQISGWQGWTADQPHKAVINRAQEAFRERHPELTEPLDDRDWDLWGSDSRPSERGEGLARRILRDAGHPAWDRVAVMPHNRPFAQTGATPDGRPAIMLTRGQWHAGSLAHEAAHLAHLHAMGVDHAERARGAPGDEIDLGLTDEQIHGPGFARHYAGALESLVPGGREEFLRDHADAARLVGNQRSRVHGLPRDFGGGIQRQAAAESPSVLYHVSPRSNRASIQENGLLAEYAEGPEAVYLHEVPGTGAKRNYDTWRVDASGLNVLRDSHDMCRDPRCEFRGEGSYYTPDDVPPERVSLQGTGKTAATGYEGLTKRSGMIYLDIPDDKVRHLPGGVDDHHITLVYLGKDVSDEAFAEACRRAEEAAGAQPPMEGSIGGLGSFPPSDSSDGKKPVFVPVDVPGIHALRKSLEDLNASQFKDYRPHVTLAYLEDGEKMPAPHPTVPVSFPSLHVKRGDEIVSFPFGGRLSKAASAHWDREDLAEHLRGPHGWIVHPEHDLEHEHAWDHQSGQVEEPHEHEPGRASHPLAGVEPPTHTEVLRSMRSGPREMPVHKALRLRSGDWGGRVIDHLDDIRQKISDEYEDGGEGLRRAMSNGVLPGGPLVVNGGQLDDGHRRLLMAHDLGWSSVQVRSGDWTPGGAGERTAIKSGVGDLYLRFGAWPHDERSYSPAGGYYEEGVSAYDLDDHGNPKDPDPHGDRRHVHDEHCEDACPQDYSDEYGNDTGEEMRGRVQRAERHRYYGEDDPHDTGHLVRGDMAGIGYDGEPLLKNVRRVGDWIDHRHQFIYSAAPHRLARGEGDEGYEPPEEKPGVHRP